MKIEMLADLECLTLRPEGAKKAVILLHGYGANMHDLFSLHEFLDPKGEWAWFFPNGPIRIPMGNFYEGRAWFQINIAALEAAMQRGQHRDLSGEVPERFDLMIDQQIHFLEEVKKQYPTVVLGGFSQGAMCSSHIALRRPELINGLILLSGNLIAGERLPELKTSPQWSYFQSHGTHDAILSMNGAQSLSDKLIGNGIKGEFYSFKGAHEIPMGIIDKVSLYLQKIT